MAPPRPSKAKPKQTPPKKISTEIATDEDEDSKPGCIYLGHIPHGFYEDEIKDYFQQFGNVLGVKLCRSKAKGTSRGYGFVKFKYAAVAKTVAETCNNYLFFNKLLKCQYKPMSEMHKTTFKRYTWRPKTVPKRKFNSARSETQLIGAVKRSLSKAGKKLERLKAAGIAVDGVNLNDIMDVPDVSAMDSESLGKGKTSGVTTTEMPTPELPKKKRKISDITSPEPSKQKIKLANGSTPKSQKKTKGMTPSSTDVSTPEPPKKKKKLGTPTTNVSTPGSVNKKKSVTPTSEPLGKKKKLNTSSVDVSTPESLKKKKSATPSTTDIKTPELPKKKTKLATPTTDVSTPESLKKKKKMTPENVSLSTPELKKKKLVASSSNASTPASAKKNKKAAQTTPLSANGTKDDVSPKKSPKSSVAVTRSRARKAEMQKKSVASPKSPTPQKRGRRSLK